MKLQEAWRHSRQLLGALFLVCNLLVSLVVKAELELQELKILAFTDLHGQIEAGARLATIMKPYLEADPDKERLLITDSGDLLQGSFEASLTRGEAGACLAELLKIDYWVPGNHDWEFGVQRLIDLSNQMPGKMLRGNLKLQGSSAQNYYIVNKGDLKVAVIGLSCENFDTLELFPVDGVSGRSLASYESHQEALARIMTEIRALAEAPEIIVLLMHRGRWSAANDNSLRNLLKPYSEIDLIIGGHSHELVEGSRIGSGWFVQSGRHGNALTVIDVLYDKKRDKVVQISSQQYKADEYEPDSEFLLAAQERLLAWSEGEFDHKRFVVTPAPERAGKTRYNNSHGALALAGMQEAYADGEVYFYVSGGEGKAGEELSIREIFELFPYEDQVVKLTVSEEELTRILTEQLSCAVRYGSNLQFDGLKAKVGAGNRLLSWSLNSGDISAQNINLITNAFAASGGGGRYPELRAITRRCRDNGELIIVAPFRESIIKFLQKSPRKLSLTPFLERIRKSEK